LIISKIKLSLNKKFGKKATTKASESRQKRDKFVAPNNITLSELRKEVQNFQYQLAVAIRNKDKVSVKRLIRQMQRSEFTRSWAVYRTIASAGARSKGIGDKSKPKTAEQYAKLAKDLWSVVKNPSIYKAQPLKRVWLEKPNSPDYRPISVPSYLDRAVQHLFLLILDVFQEEFADPNSFGFRKFRSPGWASKAITLAIWSRKQYGPPKYAVELDIAKCFDSISHDFITKNVGTMTINNSSFNIIPQQILQAWLKSGYIDVCGKLTPKDQIIPTEVGVPQGGPISPTIANIVLNGIEECVKDSLATKQPEIIGKGRDDLVSTDDKIIWKFEGKPVLCTINISDTKQINQQLRLAGFTLPVKSFARSFLSGRFPHSRAGWSYEKLEYNNPYDLQRTENQENYNKTFRFADDCVLLVNTQKSVNTALEAITKFLGPRGMKLNLNKTHIRELEKESFFFVGFEFKITQKNGKNKIYCFPPREKIDNLKLKVNEIIKFQGKSPYYLFYKLNSVLRGWLNFYSIGNSSRSFNNINNWLWHTIYKYFYRFVKYDPHFRISSNRQNRKLINQKIFEENLTKYEDKFAKWWSIPVKFFPRANKRFIKDGKPYALIQPRMIKVATPSIITGKSAYYPNDRQELEIKALYWKKRLIKSLLTKTHGQCALCKCSLCDSDEVIEIHHLKPISLGGKNKFVNLAPLCYECHKTVTISVQKKDIPEIQAYEKLGILSDVSNKLTLSDTTQ
jgi:retron-type reverse transcriptase